MKRRNSLHLALVLLILAPAVSVTAQDEKPKAQPIPGFEELFAAGNLLEASKEFQAAQEEGATLTEKRTALDSKPVAEALRLLRVWINKPGREIKVGALAEAPLANLRHFRVLGRALAIEQYVSLAGGRVDDAIESARAGFRLAHALKPNNYVTWLYGAAIESAMAMNLGRHLEQFSRRDSDRLAILAKDWLNTPDAAPVALEIERNLVLKNYQNMMQQAAQEAASDPTVLPDDADDEPPPPELAKLSPAEIQKAQAEIPAHLNALFVRLQAELKKPLWEAEQPVPPLAPKSASERMAQPFVQLLEEPVRRIFEVRGKQQAMARLLACHAAILRYRWEHDRLPATLEELKLEDTTRDPFSGKSFVYHVLDRKYTLESVGPLARDDKGNRQTEQRAPISLTPRPKTE